MYAVAMDLEGVLVPEIWIAFAQATGISELKLTTRDEPDYDKLMRYRLDILDAHHMRLPQIQEVIAGIEPFDGARAFLDALRAQTLTVVISDTFTQFARPLIEKLGQPALFCNELIVGDDGRIEGWRMRCSHTKLTTVQALQSMGYETIAFGDSFNDLEMIRASKTGFLFHPPAQIAADNPDVPTFEDYNALLAAIETELTAS